MTVTQKNLQKGVESQNRAFLLIFVGYALAPLLSTWEGVSYINRKFIC